jgi:hypothetical protein
MVSKCESEGKNLGKIISVRVSDEVYFDFETQCKAANMSKTEIFRDYIFKNKVQINARSAPSREARRAILLLQKISNNINDLLFFVNKDSLAGSLSDQYYSEVIKQLVQLNKFTLSQASEIK